MLPVSNQMRFLLLFIYMFHSALPQAYAGSELRNGGYGVLKHGAILSLDLAEAEVENDPETELSSEAYTKIFAHQKLAPALKNVLEHLGDAKAQQVLKLVQNKLGLFYELSRRQLTDYPAASLLSYAKDLRWVGAFEQKCLDVQDDLSTTYPNKIQLAYRQGLWVRFCADAYKLDHVHFAALILHELIYSAHDVLGDTKRLVGFLFDKALLVAQDAEKTADFRAALQRMLPQVRGRIRRLTNPALTHELKPGWFQSGDERIEVVTVINDDEGMLTNVHISWAASPPKVRSTVNLECDTDGICRQYDFMGKVLRVFVVKDGKMELRSYAAAP